MGERDMTEGYEPRWDIDLDYGSEGEQLVRNVLGLSNAHVEVKHKRYTDDIFYVETAHDPGRQDAYKSSGINTTQAEYWAYVIAETGVVVLMPTGRLKQAARNSPRAAETDGDCPTRGRLVSLMSLLAEA